MTALTYLDMQTRVADELSRTDLTAQIKLAILSAVEHYKRERFWWNEGFDTASTVSGTRSYAMPDSAAERPLIFPDQLQITVNSTLRDVGPQGRPSPHSEVVGLTYSTSHTGIPRKWSYFADAVWLYPIPNGTYTLTLWYVVQLAALSVDADTNGWMTEAEELIRARAKWDLYLNVIRNPEEASLMRAAEADALSALRGHRAMRMASEVVPYL